MKKEIVFISTNDICVYKNERTGNYYIYDNGEYNVLDFSVICGVNAYEDRFSYLDLTVDERYSLNEWFNIMHEKWLEGVI